MANQQMPQVAKFSLPEDNSQQPQNQSVQNTSGQQMPQVAKFSLPGQDTSNTPNNEGFVSKLSKGDYGGAAIEGAKNVGDFIFPIVGDVYHDVKGDSTKSFTQQAGDAALSALPFIPGLGEVGMAAKGVEGAGLLAKAVANPVVRNAAVGYGAGVASNLSQGKGIGESLMPNVNTVGGTLFGAASPKVMSTLSSFRKTLSGISPEVSLAFQRDFTPKDLPDVNKYINIAQKRASGEIMPSVENTAADQLDKAAEKVSTKVDKIGSEVGKTKKAVGNLPLTTIKDVGQSFWQKVNDDYGLNLMTGENGKIVASPISGRNIQITPGDKSRILNIAQQLSDLGTKPSIVGNATDVLHNINGLVDLSKQDIYGNKNDPLESLIKYVGGNLNQKIRASAPQLADVNDKFSKLKDIQEMIRQMAGNKLQRGELLMKRVFTNNSKDSLDLFNTLKKETGIDLQKHAIMAKHAVESFGGSQDKSTLEKMITDVAQGKGSITNSILEVAQGKAKNWFANPKKVGTNMITNKNNPVTKGLINKGAIKVGTNLGGLIGQ